MSLWKYMGFMAGCCLLVTGAWAQDTAQVPMGPYEVVQQTTVRVMDVVAGAEEYVDEDPERYYQQVQEIFDPVIDFRGFARRVMGPYGSSARYKQLDETGRVELREQLDRFTAVIRLELVRTYSKGLLAFGGSRIKVLQPAEDVTKVKAVSVRQLVYSDQPEPYVLTYSMGRDKRSGQWLLRNVIIETVNLGTIYQSQFEAEARKYDGDLNSVIDNWNTLEVET
jgi:phospholipid transport system substrate-binding protein